jgi:hypothetical protein
MSSFRRKIVSWGTFAEAMFIVLGLQISLTGRLRTVINLGEVKYLVGAVSIAYGLYILRSILFGKQSRNK